MTGTHSTIRAERGGAARRSANLRTAITLGSIAAVFFFGIIGARVLGDGSTGIVVLGAAVLLYLALAIGRHLRR